MTTISRKDYERVLRFFIDQPKIKVTGENLVHKIGRKVEPTAEQKARIARDNAVAAASKEELTTFLRQIGKTVDSSATDTYTKFGKMSTEEKEAYVQQRLATFDEAQAHHQKYLQELENRKQSDPAGAQASNANPANSSPAKLIRYEESREIYASNISELSLKNAKKTLFFVESSIRNQEHVGRNFHGHNGDQPISDINTYLAALKDHISKLSTSATPTTSEPGKGTA